MVSLDTEEDLFRDKLERDVDSSNEILGDREQETVRELISEAQGEISSLDAEILRLQTALASLIDRRAHQTQRVERLRVGVAPHKRLPPELLARIFVHSIDDEPVHVYPNGDSHHWFLLRVCSRWRHIALAEPALWSDVDLPGFFDPKISYVAIIDEILSRGKSTISLGGAIPDMSSGLLHTLIDKYSDKLRSFRAGIYHDISTESPAPPFQSLKMLDTLVLTYGETGDTPSFHPVLVAFSKAPKLTRLDIRSVKRHRSLPRAIPDSFPWAQLQHLAISDNMVISPVQLLALLRLCRNLISCDVAFAYNSSSDPAPQNTESLLILKCLRSLNFTFSQNRISGLIDSLVLPSLKVFTTQGGITAWPQDAILRLIERSQCNIETFYISTFPISADVEPLMHAMPSATKFLVLSNTAIADRILDQLRVKALLPNVELFGGHMASRVLLQEVLESRWKQIPPEAGRAMCDVTILLQRREFTEDWRKLKALMPSMTPRGKVVRFKIV